MKAGGGVGNVIFCNLDKYSLQFGTNAFCISDKLICQIKQILFRKLAEVTRTGLTRSGDISEGWWRSWKCYKLCNSKLPELVSFHKIVFGTGKSFLNILPNTFHPLIYLQKNVRKLEQQRCENHGHSSLGAYLLKKYDICVFLSQIEIRM